VLESLITDTPYPLWTKQRRRSGIRRFLPILTVGVLFYFGYHLYHGEYGLYSRATLEEHIALLQAERKKLESQRMLLEKRVTLLRDGAIERDMLDEYARKNLNLSFSNEITIIIPKEIGEMNQNSVE